MAQHPFLPGLPVHDFTLDNGLRLYVVRDSSAPVVAWQTWFGVGSSDEVPGRTGLAHLLEHLMFKATQDYGEGEFTARLDALGATGLNAWTWLDQTAYTEAVPRGALEEVARLESSRMARLRLDQPTFASEREVVMNERRWAVDDDPSGKLSEALFARAFGREHPYGWPTLGWMADIEALTLDDVLAFYGRHYAPDNARILVVGDAEPQEVLELVKRHYGALEPSGVQRRAVQAPLVPPGDRVEHTAPLAADRVVVGFRVPEYTHADLPALLVLDAALTAGHSARLNRALRDRGLVADLGAMIMPLRGPSLYQISLQGRPGLPAAVAEEALWEELERIREHGLSEGELALGRAAWSSITWQSLEDVAGKADFLGWSLTLDQAPDHGLQRLHHITSVTDEEVREVARRYLRPEVATTGVALAVQPAPSLSLPAREPVAPAPLSPVKPLPRQDAAPLTPGELVQDEVLGATVLRSLDPTLPLVHFRLWLPVGGVHDPQGQEGVAWVATQMVLRGTRSLDRAAFEAALEQLGATVQITADADALLLHGVALSETWPRVVALLASALAEPAVRPADLQRLVEEVCDDLASLRDEDGDVAGVALDQAVYGAEHPYGRDVRGTIASLRRLTPEAVRAWLATHLRAQGALLALVGDLDPSSLADARALLGAIPGAPPPRPRLELPEPRPRVVVVDKPERTQVQVRLGHCGLDHRRPDFPALLLANDAFGVGFSGRLMQEVREKRGWSYFAYSSPLLHDQTSEWVSGMAPSTEQAPQAIALVLDLVSEAADQGFTEEELDQARSTRVQAMPFLVATARKRLDLELRRRTTGYDRLEATRAMQTIDRVQANTAFSTAIQPHGLVVACVATAQGFVEALREQVDLQIEVVSLEDLGL